jgi:hypothetical protein
MWASEAPPVPLGSCHIVLCCNVLIYPNDDGLRAAVANLEAALAPQGMLFVGAAESLWGAADRLEALPQPSDLVAQARDAAGKRDHEGAARALRQAASLDPHEAAAHAGLASALEAVSDARAAARARAAGTATARRRTPAETEETEEATETEGDR